MFYIYVDIYKMGRSSAGRIIQKRKYRIKSWRMNPLVGRSVFIVFGAGILCESLLLRCDLLCHDCYLAPQHTYYIIWQIYY